MTRRQWVHNYANEHDTSIQCADGFEDAIMGLVYRKGMGPVVLYDREKCIQILMNRDGMDRETAEEHFGFNVDEAWVGESTPAWAILIPPKEAK